MLCIIESFFKVRNHFKKLWSIRSIFQLIITLTDAHQQRQVITTICDNILFLQNSLIITSDSKESELYFYDANGEMKNISERKQFETLTEAQAWVKTYDCAGHIISVHNGSDWVPYIVSADGKLSPVNAGDISVGDVKVIDGGAANGIQ